MFRRIFEFATNHPRSTFRGTMVFLISIVILQNYESTSIDFLFWTLADSPKIFVILISMLIGALVWEMYRPASFMALNKH